jgi:hypothetical protein
VTIDDPVVERQRENHDLPDRDLAIAHDRTFFDPVHAHDPDVWKVQDRYGEKACLLAQ